MRSRGFFGPYSELSACTQSMICNCTHFYWITLGVLAKKSHHLVYLTSMLACYHALFERPPWSSRYSKRYIFNSYHWFTYWYMYNGYRSCLTFPCEETIITRTWSNKVFHSGSKFYLQVKILSQSYIYGKQTRGVFIGFILPSGVGNLAFHSRVMKNWRICMLYVCIGW